MTKRNLIIAALLVWSTVAMAVSMKKITGKLYVTNDVGVGTASPNLGSVGGRWLTIMGTASNAGGFLEFATPTATTVSGQDIGGINAFNGTVHSGEINNQNTSGGSSANYAWRFRSATGTSHLFEMFRVGGPGATTSAYAQTGQGGAAGLTGVNNIGFDVTGTSNSVDSTGETLGGATFGSGATGVMASFRSKPYTETASFTTASMRHFYQDQATLGTGHTVTREIGFYCSGKATGGTVGQFACLSDNLSFSADSFISQTGTNPSSLAGPLTLGDLTASRAVFTDSNKKLVSNTTTGSGSVVMSASPTLSGTITGAAATMSGTVQVDGQLIGKGTATNDNASAGYIGEELTATANGVALTNANAINITSLSITAGHWRVSGSVCFINSGMTATMAIGAIGTTNTSLGSNYTGTKTSVYPIQNNDTCIPVGPFPLKLSATTTYYLNGREDFSAGSGTMGGTIYAVRVR